MYDGQQQEQAAINRSSSSSIATHTAAAPQAVSMHGRTHIEPTRIIDLNTVAVFLSRRLGISLGFSELPSNDMYFFLLPIADEPVLFESLLPDFLSFNCLDLFLSDFLSIDLFVAIFFVFLSNLPLFSFCCPHFFSPIFFLGGDSFPNIFCGLCFYT